MDPSIRLRAVLGENAVDVRELEPSERVAIFKGLLEECKPQLKYLPCFKPIGDELNCVLEGRNMRRFRETAFAVVEFPANFNLETRCMDLGRFYMNTHIFVEGYIVEYRNLLITQKGELVRWLQRYRCEHRQFSGNRFHESGDYDVALMSRFSFCDGMALEMILTSQTLKNCIVNLAKYIHASIEAREHRLQNMQKLEVMVLGLQGCIKT